MDVRGRRAIAALSAYFGLVCLFFAVLSMRNGAGTSVDGFVEVLVVVGVAGLCFSLAWVVVKPTLRRR